MFARTRNMLLCAIVCVIALALLTSCKREKRELHASAPAANASRLPLQTELRAGLGDSAATTQPSRVIEVKSPATKRPDLDQNAYAMSEGKRLFSWMNCSGCHGNGGGDKGPPLMDEHWIYGSAPEQIFDTIVQGRPNGMPAYRGRIPDAQVWQLVAYVRSISGLASHSAAPGRNEHMQSNPAENSMYPTKHKQSSTPPTTSEFSR
jgi:cytochrome c oxidase cbb3-type subunit III